MILSSDWRRNPMLGLLRARQTRRQEANTHDPPRRPPANCQHPGNSGGARYFTLCAGKMRVRGEISKRQGTYTVPYTFSHLMKITMLITSNLRTHAEHLKSLVPHGTCRFDSGPPHHSFLTIRQTDLGNIQHCPTSRPVEYLSPCSPGPAEGASRFLQKKS
jgi:hypothetical protein